LKIKQLTRSDFVKYGGFSVWLGRRFWESRQFYSAYIALFIAVSNWITIQYRLLLENVPFMNYLFSNIWVFMITATIVFTILSVLGGHYIHRKRQFRIEQAVATEENPYLYRAAPGKERDLMIPIIILQLDTLETILTANHLLTEEKKNQFDKFRKDLVSLSEGRAFGKMWEK
jgi:hypothetical protein